MLTSTASLNPVRLSKTTILEESPVTGSSAGDLAGGIRSALELQISSSTSVAAATSCSAQDAAASSSVAGIPWTGRVQCSGVSDRTQKTDPFFNSLRFDNDDFY